MVYCRIMKRRTAFALLHVLVFAAPVALGACGSDVQDGEGGVAGQGGAASGAAAPGGGGQGGASFESCADCSPPNDVCVDDAACAAICPAGRMACETAAQGDAPDAFRICCGEGDQCCPDAGGSFCAPAGAPCPVACPDGSICPSPSFCQLDPFEGTYHCEQDCPVELTCGDVCCPLGSQCEGGVCPLPDIWVDQDYLQASVETVVVDVSPNSCSLMEGCIGAPGKRKLLKFSTRTPNTGEGDLYLGDPSGNDAFVYSTCHDHFHFQGYAEYRLLDENGQALAVGHKQAFCLEDFDPYDANAPEAKYDCGFQGIQLGWSDIYDRDLPCQWIDITDVPAGNYQLEIALNYQHTLAELDYTNDSAAIPIVVEADSCPNGCNPTDAACCADGDPCGKAQDGVCDCGGFYDWDVQDCHACLECEMATTCVGGCAVPEGDSCCAPGDPCHLANDDVCNCGGLEDWDEADCTSCISSDPDCASVNTCPNGCTTVQQAGFQCCGSTDTCGFANDGWCDCGGTTPWDYADCTHCTTPGC